MSGRSWRGAPYTLQVSLERRALRVAVNLADPRPSDRWLDVATGTAALMHELARRGQRPDRVIGIDSSPSMLARAGPLPRGWETAQADTRALPFPNRSFDKVSMAYLLHTLDTAQRTEVLEEAHRVLRPGGSLIAVTLEARRMGTRRLLSLLPRAAGLSPLDPTQELVASGLSPRTGRVMHGGWPTLCILATRQ